VPEFQEKFVALEHRRNRILSRVYTAHFT
jgi:hypothetical protein